MNAADKRANKRTKAVWAELSDFGKALALAQNVLDPWHRSKSLAELVRLAPEKEMVLVANEALKAAQLTGEAYKRVVAAAWTVAALAERGKTEQVQTILPALLEEARQIEHPVNKSDALVFVWQAVWTLPISVKQPVLDALLIACHAANSWRAGRIMRYVALVVAEEDRQQGQQIIDSMRKGIYQRTARKRFDIMNSKPAQ